MNSVRLVGPFLLKPETTGLMVRKDQIEEVRELLRGIELAYTVISLGNPLD